MPLNNPVVAIISGRARRGILYFFFRFLGLPGDVLFLIATDEQIVTARKLIHPKEPQSFLPHDDLYSFESLNILEAGDLVWVFGHQTKIHDLKKVEL